MEAIRPVCTEILLRWQEEHNPGSRAEEAALDTPIVVLCCASLPDEVLRFSPYKSNRRQPGYSK